MIPIADVQLRFRAESSGARRDVAQLKQEIQELRQGMVQTQRTATEATQVVNRLGNEAKAAAIGVTSLSRNLSADMLQANQVLEVLRSELERYSAIVRIAEDNANTYALSSQVLAASQEAAAQAIRNAEDALRDGALAYGEYVAASARVRENIEALAGGQAALNDFWRIASGQVEDYSESIETTIPSIVNLTEAENALTAAIEANLQTLQDATGDPLSDYVDTLTLTSETADAAFGSINRVGEAVRNADFRRAEAELRDFDDAFRLSEATIPQVRSEMERFTGTLPDATRSIRDTTIALQNMSQEAQAAARDAEFLNASFSAIDAFDPRTPHLNVQSFDTVGFAARTGEELASQAIRTAGQLRRIEQERVESLADLEREYSERIIAINEEKRRRLAEVEAQIEAERVRRLASIQQAFADAADAEVAARERAADRIQQIEARAAEQREQLRERLNERLVALEEHREARIQELNEGFTEREQARQQRILEITENASEARVAAEQRYADEVQAINNRLVEDVLAVQRQLTADIESLEAGFVQRQADRASEIVRVTEEAADARTAANQTYVDEMQGIYNDLVEAWDTLEDGFTARQAARAQQRIAISQNAAAARAAAYQDYTETVARISTDLVDTVRDIQAEITEVIADAAAERVNIEQDAIDARAEANADYAEQIEAIEADRVEASAAYARTLARISTDLVDDVRDIQREITQIIEDAAAERVEIEQDAINARAEAEADYARKIEDITEERNRNIEQQQERIERQQARITEIQEGATAARLLVDERYADRFQDIQNDLVDSVVGIQGDLNDRLNGLRDDQLDAERDRLQSFVELHEETQERLEDLARGGARTREDIEQEFQRDVEDARRRALRQFIDAGGPNATAEQQERIERNLTRRLLDAGHERNRALQDLTLTEQRRREDLARDAAAREVEIAERAAARQSEIAQQQVDVRTAAAEGIAAAESAAGVSFEDAQANYVPALSAHEEALRTHAEALNTIAAAEASDSADVNQRISEIHQELSQTIETSFTDAATAAMTLAETLAAVSSAEEERLSALGTETAGTLSGLNQQITDAEARTGLSFEEALANYTPAVDLNTQALNTLNETLAEISVAQTAVGANLNETLTAITTGEQASLSALGTQTAGTVAGLNQQIADAQTRAGLSFEEALQNYKPTVDLNTQALNALNQTLTNIGANQASAFTRLSAAETADRASTTVAQQALETGAGVSIEDARANFVPALSSAAQATLTLNQTMLALDTSFKAAIAEIQDAGLVDRQSVDDAIQTAIANAVAQQTALETQAGTTFAEASAAFQPGLSDIAQAGFDRDTALSGIHQTESAGIDAVNAQAIADRLETDAAITETRDQYIKTRDAEIAKHNTAILQLNLAEAADIKAVRAALDKDLANIDAKLDAELAEIRETKMVFDTKISELITAINSDANESIATLNADTRAMRVELEAIAAEQRNNAWKQAILKVANVGITIAGVAAGTAVGAPQAGLVAGQAVGGLVEQGGAELFHFRETDAIARRLSRQAAFWSPRPAPDYLPTPDQLRNARDVGREVVAGFTEGLAQRGRNDGGLGDASPQASLPEEMSATVVLQFNDGSVSEFVDQILRLREQDRTNL